MTAALPGLDDLAPSGFNQPRAPRRRPVRTLRLHVSMVADEGLELGFRLVVAESVAACDGAVLPVERDPLWDRGCWPHGFNPPRLTDTEALACQCIARRRA